MPRKSTADNADLRAIAVGAVFTIKSLGQAPGIDRVAEVIYNAMLDAIEARKK